MPTRSLGWVVENRPEMSATPETLRGRPHQTLGNRTPMAVWRAGRSGSLGERAVNMMDNARALPTCPQPQRQQQQPCAA